MLKVLVPFDGSSPSKRAIRHVSGITGLLMGSVAMKVLHLVTIPVTLVK